MTEILSDSPENEGNFDDGARVQEVVNAVEQSFRERRWAACHSPDPRRGARSVFRTLLPCSTRAGDFHGHARDDHLLPDWSPEGLEATVSEMKTLRTILGGAPFDPSTGSGLSPARRPAVRH